MIPDAATSDERWASRAMRVDVAVGREAAAALVASAADVPRHLAAHALDPRERVREERSGERIVVPAAHDFLGKAAQAIEVLRREIPACCSMVAAGQVALVPASTSGSSPWT